MHSPADLLSPLRHQAMYTLQRIEREMYTFCFEIEQLSANHAATTRRRHQVAHDISGDSVREPKGLRCMPSAARREWHHRQPRSRCNRHTVYAMYRWPSASNIIVIHARQVVVHKRVRVHHLDRGSKITRIRSAAASAIRFEKQNGAQPLSFAQQRITDRFRDERRDLA